MDFAEKLARRMLYSHVRVEEEGCSLLDYLAGNYPHRSADCWLRHIADGNVHVNGRPSSPSAPLGRHDLVAYFPGETVEPEAELRYKVLYEDEDLLVIDKPGNLCVHPTGPFFRHTLWHLVGSDYGEVRFVNRLDRETSGLLVAARNARTAARMAGQLNLMHKEYLALVFGRFQGSVRARGVLVPETADAAGKVAAKKRRFLFIDLGSEAAERVDTELRAEADWPPDMTLVRAVPHTGRQHQIRATLCSLGYPLVGDKLYGPDGELYLKIRDKSLTAEDLRKLRMPRQALHSALLSFPHPYSGAVIRCVSPCDFRLITS